MLRSIAIRQALLAALVMLVAIVAMEIATVTLVEHALRDQRVQTIDTDIAGLTDVMVQGGLAELRHRIADRADFADGASQRAYYALYAPGGSRLAGTVERPGAVDAARSPLIELLTPQGTALARVTVLRGGLTLLVGRSRAPDRAVVASLRRGFALAGAGAVLLSLLVGGLFAAGLERRVAAITAAIARFRRGDLAARPAGAVRHDEIGTLASEVAGHLGWSERLLLAQREISDNIAHELRTPLTHLDARLLHALDANRDDAIAAHLSDARGDIRAIVSLFDTLLDIGLAETASPERVFADFDLAELSHEVAEIYRSSAEEAGIDFSVRVEPLVRMRGEAMAIKRVIANLLDNALKYVPPGSRLCLAVTAGPRIVVEDNGGGIPPDQRARIFDRFRRGRAGGEGHGLGLALVGVIAVRHGLALHYEDACPGARFILEPAR